MCQMFRKARNGSKMSEFSTINPRNVFLDFLRYRSQSFFSDRYNYLRANDFIVKSDGKKRWDIIYIKYVSILYLNNKKR